jgi:hypothetical protein
MRGHWPHRAMQCGRHMRGGDSERPASLRDEQQRCGSVTGHPRRVYHPTIARATINFLLPPPWLAASPHFFSPPPEKWGDFALLHPIPYSGSICCCLQEAAALFFALPRRRGRGRRRRKAESRERSSPKLSDQPAPLHFLTAAPAQRG